MKEDKTLLCITRMEDGIRVQSSMEDPMDMLDVCVGVSDLLHKNQLFSAILQAVYEEQENNKEYAKVLEENTIEVPDFNKILKQNG